MSSEIDADAIVVGGGISGLCCAWNLQQKGLSTLVLEAGAQAGGCISTTREEGCLVEAGPNGALDTTPLIGQLLKELGITDERIAASTAARNRYILRQGRLIALPLSPLEFISTNLFSRRAKLRLLAEPFIPAGASALDETVAAFVARRLGREFLDYAINPFVAGVYAGDPETLSVAAAFPRLHELEQTYGSLIRGYLFGRAARKHNPENSKQVAPMFSFRAGMQTITDALARKIKRVELSTAAVKLTRDGSRYKIAAQGAGGERIFHARAVVLATPAYAATGLVSTMSPAAAAALAQIVYPPVAVVVSAYPKAGIAHALDGFGMLIPEVEQKQTLGTIFSSTLFSNRAPPEEALLTTFIGGARQPALARLSSTEIASVAQTENAPILGARVAARFTHVKQWERAIPQYAVGHAGRMAALESAEAGSPGLFFCANYRGGVALGDCVKSAVGMASRVGAFLKENIGA